MVLLQRPAVGPGTRTNWGPPQGKPQARRRADRTAEGQGRGEDPPAGVRSGGGRATSQTLAWHVPRRSRGPTPRTAREPESAQAAYTEAVKRLARQPQSRGPLRERLPRVRA